MDELKTNDTIDKIKPFKKFFDDTESPYGKKRSDGIFTLNYDTIMNGKNGGYIVDAIFGVFETRKLDDGYTMYDEHIFVGECPHQDENGKWVTHNEVPNFIRHTSTCEPVCIEPDTPFIVRVIPELYYNDLLKKSINQEKELSSKINKLQYQIDNCTFKMYLKGLWNRIKIFRSRQLHFVSYTGDYTYHFGIEKPTSEFQFCYWKDFETGEKYISMVTDKTITRWTFYKDGKLTWEKKSWENSHCYCAC